MPRNRIRKEVPIQLPRPPAPQGGPTTFLWLPPACFPGLTVERWLWQQYLCRWAYAQAQAVVRPSLPERDLLAVWN